VKNGGAYGSRRFSFAAIAATSARSLNTAHGAPEPRSVRRANIHTLCCSPRILSGSVPRRELLLLQYARYWACETNRVQFIEHCARSRGVYAEPRTTRCAVLRASSAAPCLGANCSCFSTLGIGRARRTESSSLNTSHGAAETRSVRRADNNTLCCSPRILSGFVPRRDTYTARLTGIARTQATTVRATPAALTAASAGRSAPRG
jgi:hypothetical protein